MRRKLDTTGLLFPPEEILSEKRYPTRFKGFNKYDAPPSYDELFKPVSSVKLTDELPPYEELELNDAENNMKKYFRKVPTIDELKSSVERDIKYLNLEEDPDFTLPNNPSYIELAEMYKKLINKGSHSLGGRKRRIRKSQKKRCNGYISRNMPCKYCKSKKGVHYHNLNTRKKCKNYRKQCTMCKRSPKSSHYHTGCVSR